MLQNQGPDWNDNRILCQKQGADPVFIETVKDWNFLNDLIQKPKSNIISGHWFGKRSRQFDLVEWKITDHLQMG